LWDMLFWANHRFIARFHVTEHSYTAKNSKIYSIFGIIY
jgi:hypothetical protein